MSAMSFKREAHAVSLMRNTQILTFNLDLNFPVDKLENEFYLRHYWIISSLMLTIEF